MSLSVRVFSTWCLQAYNFIQCHTIHVVSYNVIQCHTIGPVFAKCHKMSYIFLSSPKYIFYYTIFTILSFKDLQFQFFFACGASSQISLKLLCLVHEYPWFCTLVIHNLQSAVYQLLFWLMSKSCSFFGFYHGLKSPFWKQLPLSLSSIPTLIKTKVWKLPF